MRADDATRATRVGLTLLLSLVLLAAGIWILGNESRVWSRKVEYEIAFRNVQGLSDGTTITLAGYRIGKVSEIHLPDDLSKALVEVTISVEKKNSRYIRRDTKARIKTIGILGDKYIELSPGSLSEPELLPGSDIEAIQPPNLESLMAQGESVADNVAALTLSLRKIIDKVDKGQGLLGALISDTPQGQQMTQDIKDVLARVSSVSRKVDEGDGLAGTLINDPRPAADLKAAVATLSRVARSLEHGDGLAARLLSDPELARTITGDLKDASRRLSDVTRKLDAGEGLAGRLLSDQALADDVTRDIRQATESIASITRRAESGEGTIGKLLVDETLYEGLNDILAGARKSRLTRWFLSRSQKAGASERLAGTGDAAAGTGEPSPTPKPKSEKKPKTSAHQAPPRPSPTATPLPRGVPVITPVPPRGPFEEPTAPTPAPGGTPR